MKFSDELALTRVILPADKAYSLLLQLGSKVDEHGLIKLEGLIQRELKLASERQPIAGETVV